jgi:hypothetical protein
MCYSEANWLASMGDLEEIVRLLSVLVAICLPVVMKPVAGLGKLWSVLHREMEEIGVATVAEPQAIVIKNVKHWELSAPNVISL